MNTTEIIHIVIFGCGFLVLFAIGELLYHVFKLDVELTRKFAHFGTGLICLLLPVYFTTHWSILILNVLFMIILGVSKKFGWLKSINAVERKTQGAVLFPIVMYACWCLYLYLGDVLYFYVPVLILAISDPIAALFGKRWPAGRYSIFGDKKTLVGSTAFFLSACCISLAAMSQTGVDIERNIISSLSVGLITSFAEACAQRGFDNLFIPLSAVATLWCFNQFIYV